MLTLCGYVSFHAAGVEERAVCSPMADSPDDVTQLLLELRVGGQNAAEQLLPLVYKELRRLAVQQLRNERPNHTLQATALVHEAYLRLVRTADRSWNNRAHFIGVAAQVMRTILVDYARSWNADKRISHRDRTPLAEQLICSPERSYELVALDDALTLLAALSPRQSRVVELRYFGGLSVEETAEVLGISPKTVKRDWSFARAWLHAEIEKQ
jgi:RNA polymerase sigma factor (TIGR02999 family)